MNVRRMVSGVVLTGLLVAGSACDGGAAGRPGPAATGQGSPAAAAGHGSHTPAPESPPLRDGERFVTLSLPRAYTPAAPNGGTDEYRCFLVDPGLTGNAFLTGSRFLPQNAAVVHHAIFFRVMPAQVQIARQVDADSAGEGWTCFGDAGIPGDAAWVAHWAPGVGETGLAADLGYPMPAGSRLIMQVHYNLLGVPRGTTVTDRSGIRLRFTGRTDVKPLETALLPAPVELPCAAGETGPLCDREAAIRDVTRRFGQQSGGFAAALDGFCGDGRAPAAGPVQSCDHPAPGAGTVYAAGGHMHLLGRSITVQLNPGTPGARTLLEVPAYNFDEQAVAPLPEPVALAAGDTLRVTCRHDATLRQRLPQLRDTPPRYVVWGDGTTDEMCLGLLVWSRAR